MKHFKRSASLILGVLLTAPAFAQTAPGTQSAQAADASRDAKQQESIEKGLQSGQLTTKEASRLEKRETRIEKLEAKDSADGKISKKEQQSIKKEQARASQEISADRNNAEHGNPQSTSAKRLEKDVQSNASDQKRIEQGIKSGALNEHEAGSLERGQAHDTGEQAKDAASGHVSKHEQKEIAHAEEHQSKQIHKDKTKH